MILYVEKRWRAVLLKAEGTNHSVLSNTLVSTQLEPLVLVSGVRHHSTLLSLACEPALHYDSIKRKQSSL
jgi:hypothetical protein